MVIFCDLSHFKLAIAACRRQKLAMWVKSGIPYTTVVLAFPIKSKLQLEHIIFKHDVSLAPNWR